jgi:hypothetical protein
MHTCQLWALSPPLQVEPQSLLMQALSHEALQPHQSPRPPLWLNIQMWHNKSTPACKETQRNEWTHKWHWFLGYSQIH